MRYGVFMKKYALGALVLAVIGLFFINSYFKEKNAIAREKLEVEKIQSAREECLNIYKQESIKYTNVNTWQYNVEGNLCYITYNDDPAKTEAQCKNMFKDSEGNIATGFAIEYLLCLDGKFRKGF